MSRTDDPQGTRALFSGTASGAPTSTREPSGKVALFSSAQRRPATVVLDCSSCHGRTRVDYLDLARRHLPAWLWFPWRSHSRFIRCPACERRAWVAAHWLQ